MQRQWRARLATLAVLAVATLCGVDLAPANSAPAAAAEVSSSVRPEEYRLDSGDKIRVTTFGEESLTGEFVVSGTGRVSFPLIGEIDASGKSASELQVAIQEGLKLGYIKEPRVSVEILTYRPFYILGEVVKPGEYPYANGLTVVSAVATAGGFTYRGDQKRVFIKRQNENAEKAYPITSSTPIYPGDTIRIRERFF